MLVSYVVDSRTESRDLLWEFDAVLRLAEAQLLGALEIAREEVRAELSIDRYLRPGPVWWAFDWNDSAEQARRSNSPQPAVAKGCSPKNGCVLLIDEIDKAEPDVPNGLLEALGANQFTPFGRETPVVARGESPLVVITTNEERALPDAFVRRCLVLHLSLPATDAELKSLLVERGRAHFCADQRLTEELLGKSADLLIADRRAAIAAQSTPRPGQAEYLDLVRAALGMADELGQDPLEIIGAVAEFTVGKRAEQSP